MTSQGLGARIRRSAGRILPDRLGRGGDERAGGRRDKKGGRGAAELSVVVVAGSLVAGVFFGQGLSNTAVDVADGLTWLSDDPSGEVIQVNPATGALQVRQKVGNPGDDVEVAAQYGDRIYVADHTSGQLLAFDLTSILVSGQRRISTGGDVDTLGYDGHVFLVDPEQSTIASIDPELTDPIGTIWVAPAGLADAAIDGDGTVWALEDDGALHSLRWSDDVQEFEETEVYDIAMSGPGSVLVAHDEGVTVFGPDQGIVAQEGTDHPMQADAAKLSGKLFAPEKTASDLVPVSAPETGTVVILSPEGIREVDMGSVACAEPGTPEIFRDRIYVPCTGESRVVQLTADGTRADADIETPGSENPELVLDDDNLIINAPGADAGIVVRSDGTSGPIVRADPQIPVTAPGSASEPPTPPSPDLLDDLLGEEETPPPADPPSTDPTNPSTTGGGTGDGGPGGGDVGGGGGGKDCDRTHGGKGGKGGGSHAGGKGDRCNGPTTDDDDDTEGADPINAPSGVLARVLPEGQVEVTWDHAGFPPPTAFAVRNTTGFEYTQVKASVRSAIVKVTPGVSTSFTVTAILASQEATSTPSAAVMTTARPGAPTVTSTAAYAGDGKQEKFVVNLAWTAASANGSAVTGYDIAVTTPQGTTRDHAASSDRSRAFTWTCDQVANPSCKVGGDYTATVVATNALGIGETGVLSATAPPQPPPPLPPGNVQMVFSPTPKTVQASPDGAGQIAVTVRPSTAWSKFPGTCAVVLDGTSAPVACSARTVTLKFNNGVIYEPESGSVGHTVTFTATNERGVSTSAPYPFTSKQTPTVVPPPEPEPTPEPTPEPQPTCDTQPCPAIP